MGLFSSTPELIFPPTGEIAASEGVLTQLPDPGRWLLDLYDASDAFALVVAELDRARFPSGGYDLRDVKSTDKRGGPLSVLAWISVEDRIRTEVWATMNLGGKSKREMQSNVGSMVAQQGVPAAATWALSAWQSAPKGTLPRVEALGESLADGYNEWRGNLTNGRIIDSIRKWRR